MKKYLLVPLVATFALTACNNNVVVEYEAPVVSIMASPVSVSTPVGSTPTTTPVTVTGVAATTAKSFEVVVTESHNGSTPREVCRSTKTQFSCTDTLPALTSSEIQIAYIYTATVTDARNGKSSGTATVTVARMVP